VLGQLVVVPGSKSLATGRLGAVVGTKAIAEPALVSVSKSGPGGEAGRRGADVEFAETEPGRPVGDAGVARIRMVSPLVFEGLNMVVGGAEKACGVGLVVVGAIGLPVPVSVVRVYCMKTITVRPRLIK
jgi:hypothetical protein